jgi:phosphoribosylaminoimidazole-succinocarboxamide synthase
LKHLYSGKVRDLYEDETDDGLLLFVASDRLSVFDVVMTEPVPDKGRVLTALSAFWTDMVDAPTHLVRVVDDGEHAGRAMVVRKADMLPLECIVRGYVSGSAWKEYRANNTIHGEPVKAGLQESEDLPEPIFTPSTKATEGHDQNISYQQAVDLVGADTARRARDICLATYSKAKAWAGDRGIIIADTKLELGWIDGELAICDEILTPDSSRFWPADEWKPGTTPPSLDKQPVRDLLEASGWDKSPPPPSLSDEVIAATRSRYVEAYERLSGRSFADWPGVRNSGA